MILMLLTAIVAVVIEPSHRIASDRTGFVLDKIIPKKIDGWSMVEANTNAIVNPEQQELVNKVYDQTISRVYTNPSGQFVMLTIAYGENQSDNSQLHYPEVCYPAQGFQIISNVNTYLKLDWSDIKVKRLVATMHNRVEPITYWTTIGNKVVRGGTELKLEKLRYGFKGQIPDGLLFRVSSITDGQEGINIAYEVQRNFINELLNSIDGVNRLALAGVSVRFN